MEQMFGVDAWKGAQEPRAGRDGKWQVNRYIMEFTTLNEPCCSPCTGAHCGPNK